MVCFGNAEQPPGSPNPFSPQNCASGFISRGQQRFSLKMKEAGRIEKPFLFFFSFSFCICIGKWDANASFDVSKSFLRSWSGRGDLSRLGGRVLVRRDLMLHMCCAVEVTIQLRRRPWLQMLSVLLQLTSPAFTVYLPSPPFTSPLNYQPVLTPVTNLPTPARPTLDPLGPSAPPAACWGGLNLTDRTSNEPFDTSSSGTHWGVTGVTSTQCGHMFKSTLSTLFTICNATIHYTLYLGDFMACLQP